jgi:hypothetical protein
MAARKITEKWAASAARQLLYHQRLSEWISHKTAENVMWTVRPPRLPTKTSYTSCSGTLEHPGRSV